VGSTSDETSDRPEKSALAAPQNRRVGVPTCWAFRFRATVFLSLLLLMDLGKLNFPRLWMPPWTPFRGNGALQGIDCAGVTLKLREDEEIKRIATEETARAGIEGHVSVTWPAARDVCLLQILQDPPIEIEIPQNVQSDPDGLRQFLRKLLVKYGTSPRGTGPPQTKP